MLYRRSLKAQLAASARFLSQEEAALSQGSLPGAGISAPLQQAAGWASPSVSQGLPSCTAAPSNTLGLEESPTVEREVFGGRAGPRPTALSGVLRSSGPSPTPGAPLLSRRPMPPSQPSMQSKVVFPSVQSTRTCNLSTGLKMTHRASSMSGHRIEPMLRCVMM